MQRGSKHNIDRVEYRARATEFAERGQRLPQAKLLEKIVTRQTWSHLP